MKKILFTVIALLTLTPDCQAMIHSDEIQQDRLVKILNFTQQFMHMEDVFTVQDDVPDTLYAHDGESIKAELLRGNTLTLSVTRNFKNKLAQQADDTMQLEFRTFCTTIFRSLQHLDFLKELVLNGLDLSEITVSDLDTLNSQLRNLDILDISDSQLPLFEENEN